MRPFALVACVLLLGVGGYLSFLCWTPSWDLLSPDPASPLTSSRLPFRQYLAAFGRGSPSQAAPILPFRLHVITAVNGVDRAGLLCHFFRSALWHQIPVTVLGWDTLPPLLHHSHSNTTTSLNDSRLLRNRSDLVQLYTQEFYLGSKLTLLRRHILAQGYGADDLIVLTDSTDVLLQQPLPSLERALVHLLSPSNYSVVVTSAEHDLWPPSFSFLYDKYHATPAYAANRGLLNLTNNNNTRLHAEGYYRGLNGGTFIGRASLLLPILDALIADRPEYVEHHLVYNAEGSITAGGEEAVRISGPLLHPDTLEVVDDYLVPGVYKRNEQITWSLLYLAQSTPSPSSPGNLSLAPIVIDDAAFLLQTMQLTVEDVAARLRLALANDTQLAGRLRALSWWTDAVWRPTIRNGTRVRPIDDIVVAAMQVDQRLMTRDSPPHVPLLVHYNGPSKFQEGFGELSHAHLTGRFFYAQRSFLQVAMPYVDVRRMKAQAVAGGLFRFYSRTMAKIPAVELPQLCPAIFATEAVVEGGGGSTGGPRAG